MSRAWVIGAGLAGLSAAVRLAKAGARVTVVEATPNAGGRCRSWHDAQLGQTIDNGNHLLLSGNAEALAYLELIGASDRLAGAARARFPWIDLETGARWTIAPSDGPIPWWLFAANRRLPGTGPADYIPLLRLLNPRAGATVGATVATTGPLWHRLIEPLLVSALNTPPADASAKLAAAILRGTLAKGGRACRPLVATPSLAAAFVDPALAQLARAGAPLKQRRLRAIESDAGRATALGFADGSEPLADGDTVVLAVPAWTATELLPRLAIPTRHHAIVNAHFAVAPPPGAPPITGVVGGTVEWVFAHARHIAITVSAADRLVDTPHAALAPMLWAETARALGMQPGVLPPHRIIIEKRATFAATPEQDGLRPPAQTRLANLFLAGDWTQTGLPATIEGAIQSGARAAALAIRAARP